MVPVLVFAAAALYGDLARTRPCDRPVPYRVGAIDPRFGISRDELTGAMAEAAALWEKAAGKRLFAYDAKSGLPVNLVFDARQERANFGKAIDAQQARFDAEKARVDVLEKSYDRALAAYNRKVADANARGGAAKNEYAQLQAERQVLDKQLAALRDRIAALNAQARAINGRVRTFNADARNKFEAGKYYKNRSGTGIEIYEYSNKVQIARLLAHEFGHALGLEHVEGPGSIMHPVDEGKDLALSRQDAAELKKVCGL